MVNGSSKRNKAAKERPGLNRRRVPYVSPPSNRALRSIPLRQHVCLGCNVVPTRPARPARPPPARRSPPRPAASVSTPSWYTPYTPPATASPPPARGWRASRERSMAPGPSAWYPPMWDLPGRSLRTPPMQYTWVASPLPVPAPPAPAPPAPAPPAPAPPAPAPPAPAPPAPAPPAPAPPAPKMRCRAKAMHLKNGGMSMSFVFDVPPR